MRRGLVWSLLFVLVLAVASLGATIGLGHTPLLGLDLKGGVSVVLQPQGPAAKSQLNQAVVIIERRVNGLGVSNSQVNVQGNDVVINLPGIKDSQAALKQIGATAQLFFRPVYCAVPAYVAPSSSTTTTTTVPGATTTTVRPRVTPATSATTTKSAAGDRRAAAARLTGVVVAAGSTTTVASASTTAPSPSTTAPSPSTTAAANQSTTTTVAPNPAAGLSSSDCSRSNLGNTPSTPPGSDNQNQSVILPVDPKAFPGSNGLRYLIGPADMTGRAVSGASAVIDTTTGQYQVNLTLTSSGATQFDNIASARYACYRQNTSNPPACSQEAFELDGTIESAPDFQAASFNGQVSITGSFSSGQATDLADVLKYGSLPVRFVPQSVQTVSATIGKDSLRAGLLAGIGGIIVVMLYMILYYRALGLVVLVGLGVGGALLYSIITALGQSSSPYTLTLAGVTGIIVSIGITVDSYVVYFERLKDEVRAGRSVRQSTERSFSRAFRTVLTADLVSFMAALILYVLTIGDVRGFAFTLGLSTLLDVFTAFFFIRPAVIFVGRRRAFTESRFLGISRSFAARTEPGQL
ncbi:MAG: protein translocase subunit SecD [Actinomycetota bacterium]|nr:protein translocase subunit SecD [Actinomycetota bacterium]